MTGIETRVLSERLELRADAGKPPRLIGYASVFNSKSLDLGGFVEIVRPGAFAESLREGRDVVALVEHDMRSLVGRKSAGTLIVGEDDRGLKVEIEPPDTQVGRDLITNVRVGNLDAMSFGFRTRKDSWDVSKTPALRELLDVELFDVSVVAMAAYPKTEVAMRSFTTHRDEHLRQLVREERLKRAEKAVGR